MGCIIAYEACQVSDLHSNNSISLNLHSTRHAILSPLSMAGCAVMASSTCRSSMKLWSICTKIFLKILGWLHLYLGGTSTWIIFWMLILIGNTFSREIFGNSDGTDNDNDNNNTPPPESTVHVSYHFQSLVDGCFRFVMSLADLVCMLLCFALLWLWYSLCSCPCFARLGVVFSNSVMVACLYCAYR